jgi:hypothetical protein
MVPRPRIEVWSRVITLAVDALSWKDGGEGKRKRDEAMEVIRIIRLRRLRVYDPQSGNDDDDGDDGDAGGADGGGGFGGEYSVLPAGEIVASMTVDEVLDFGVNTLRESVPTYRLLPRTAEDDGDDDNNNGGESTPTNRVGTWHFNQLNSTSRNTPSHTPGRWPKIS